MSPSLSYPFKKTLRDMMLFYRAKEWPHLLGLVLLGFAYSQKPIDIPLFILGLTVGALSLAHGYSINDIYDTQLRIKLPHKNALLLSLLPAILCVAISGLFSFRLLAVVAFGHLTSMLYSAPPLRLKNKLLLDAVFNGLSLTSLFLVGCALYDNLTPQSLAVYFFLFIYFIPVHLAHQIQDREIDRLYGQSNTFQILGLKKTVKLISYSLLLFVIFGLLLWRLHILKPLSLLLSIMCAAFFYIHLKYIYPRKVKEEAIKRSVRSFSILFGAALLISFYL